MMQHNNINTAHFDLFARCGFDVSTIKFRVRFFLTLNHIGGMMAYTTQKEKNIKQKKKVVSDVIYRFLTCNSQCSYFVYFIYW